MAENVPILILLLTLNLAFAAEPGVKIAVTNIGLEYVSQEARNVLRQEIRTICIPDQFGSDGGVSWDLKNICIKDTSNIDTRISPNPKTRGVTLEIPSFDIKLHLDLTATYWNVYEIKVRESVYVIITEASVTLVAELGEKKGRPSVSAKSCRCTISKLSIDFHGHLAPFLLTLFERVIRNKIIKLLQDQVGDVVIEQVNIRANHVLSRTRVNVDIAKHITLDYSLIEAPTITNNYIELATKGTFYSKDNTQNSPFTPTGVPALSVSNKMLYIYVSESSANTLAYLAHNYDYLKYNVGVANLNNNYPNCKSELRISSLSAPSVKFEHEKVTVAAVASVEVVVHAPYGIVIQFVLRVSTTATVQAFIINGHLIAKITDYTFNVAIIKSYILDITEKALNKLIRDTIEGVINPGLNEFFKQGIPLPGTDIYRLYNTQVKIERGYLQVGADFEYL